MVGIEFAEIADKRGQIEVILQPQQIKGKLEAPKVIEYFKKSDYKDYFLLEDNVFRAVSKLSEAQSNNSTAPVKLKIAERYDAEVKFTFTDHDLVVFLTITTPYGGHLPSVKELIDRARSQGINRGLGIRHIKQLVEKAKAEPPGAVVEDIIARGLPAKQGKPSILKPLVPNALERILKPQDTGDSRVDMRNLGDVICVKTGTELLRRLPPTQGRPGFTVKGNQLPSKPGEWKKLPVGDGTVVSDKDENLLLASITGMPKFKNQQMWVDETFICTGVNVGTGNIDYDGAVLVNGDVTEKMVIVATGDVTINGFVESATIQAGGDIIITEGAMGKVNDASTSFSTKLQSQGNVHVQHGQGLDINCIGNVTIGRQLAYSRVVCGGSVTIGPEDRPAGNLFACEIQCHGQVSAGTLGAVSGSSLSIDFSAGFNMLLERKDTLDDLLKQLSDNNSRHQLKMDHIRSKRIHEDLKRKYEEAEEMIKNEAHLLQWLETKAEKMRAAKETYQQEIKLVATKRLYPGVIVKLNNRTWRAEREYGRAQIFYEGHQWQYEPLV